MGCEVSDCILFLKRRMSGVPYDWVTGKCRPNRQSHMTCGLRTYFNYHTVRTIYNITAYGAGSDESGFSWLPVGLP